MTTTIITEYEYYSDGRLKRKIKTMETKDTVTPINPPNIPPNNQYTTWLYKGLHKDESTDDEYLGSGGTTD